MRCRSHFKFEIVAWALDDIWNSHAVPEPIRIATTLVTIVFSCLAILKYGIRRDMSIYSPYILMIYKPPYLFMIY